eukprot:1608357-Pyramimonas_sp.AAC.1
MAIRALGFLNLTRAADELQSCSAQHLKGNHKKRQSQVSRCPNSVCYQSWVRKALELQMSYRAIGTAIERTPSGALVP